MITWKNYSSSCVVHPPFLILSFHSCWKNISGTFNFLPQPNYGFSALNSVHSTLSLFVFVTHLHRTFVPHHSQNPTTRPFSRRVCAGFLASCCAGARGAKPTSDTVTAITAQTKESINNFKNIFLKVKWNKHRHRSVPDFQLQRPYPTETIHG